MSLSPVLQRRMTRYVVWSFAFGHDRAMAVGFMALRCQVFNWPRQSRCSINCRCNTRPPRTKGRQPQQVGLLPIRPCMRPFCVSGEPPAQMPTDIARLTCDTSIPILPPFPVESNAGGFNTVFSAANLVLMRKVRNFSQEEVARRSGLATVTISKLEEGEATIPRLALFANFPRRSAVLSKLFCIKSQHNQGTEGRI